MEIRTRKGLAEIMDIVIWEIIGMTIGWGLGAILICRKLNKESTWTDKDK